MARLLAMTCLLLMLLPVSASSHAVAEVRIEMTEFAFRPATVRIPVGRPVRLTLTNRGQIAHQFETDYLRKTWVRMTGESFYTEANGLDFMGVQPGAWGRLEFMPRRTGRFAFLCTIEGHQEAGMKGVLEVR